MSGFRSEVPGNWFVDPVQLGMPSVRQNSLDDTEEGDSDSSTTTSKKAKKQDVIVDFNAEEGDVIKFAGSAFGITNLSDLFDATNTTDDLGVSSSTLESGQIVSTITFSAEYSLTVFSQVEITEESLLLM